MLHARDTGSSQRSGRLPGGANTAGGRGLFPHRITVGPHHPAPGGSEQKASTRRSRHSEFRLHVTVTPRLPHRGDRARAPPCGEVCVERKSDFCRCATNLMEQAGVASTISGPANNPHSRAPADFFFLPRGQLRSNGAPCGAWRQSSGMPIATSITSQPSVPLSEGRGRLPKPPGGPNRPWYLTPATKSFSTPRTRRSIRWPLAWAEARPQGFLLKGQRRQLPAAALRPRSSPAVLQSVLAGHGHGGASIGLLPLLVGLHLLSEFPSCNRCRAIRGPEESCGRAAGRHAVKLRFPVERRRGRAEC